MPKRIAGGSSPAGTHSAAVNCRQSASQGKSAAGLGGFAAELGRHGLQPGQPRPPRFDQSLPLVGVAAGDLLDLAIVTLGGGGRIGSLAAAGFGIAAVVILFGLRSARDRERR